MDEINHRSVKKMRVLTIALITSGALNIGLLVAGVFNSYQSVEDHFLIRPVSAETARLETSLEKCWGQLQTLSFHELVPYLTNKDSVGDGYLKRDLALSALVGLHHFHLKKALSGSLLQRREFSLKNGSKIELFPGLSNEHFEAIIRFAYEEKWPLSAQGLFKLLKKWPQKKDETLMQAFFVTPEFRSLQVLFQKTGSPQSVYDLLNLVLDGSWELFSDFAEKQAEVLNLSIEKRRLLLLQYLASHSKMGAQILVGTDFAFVAKQLDDASLIEILSLLPEKSSDLALLCKELLKSPRSDSVWTQAAKFLYIQAGEEVPQPFNLQVAIERFVGGSSVGDVVASAPVVQEAPLPITFHHHTVKEGESLWKIARQYNVKVDDIVKLNEMEKDRLFPGMILRIP